MERVEFFAFWLAVISGGISSLAYIRNFFSRKEESFLVQIATWSGIFCFAFLVLIVMLRWIGTGSQPFADPYTARIFYALTIIGAYLIIELFYATKLPKTRNLGMFVMPAGVGLMLYALSSYTAAGQMPPELENTRVFLHIASGLIAYGAFTVATFLAVMYLLLERQLKTKNPGQVWRKLPSLETSDDLCYKAILVGFIFSVVLVFSGMVSASMIWGVMWDWGEPRLMITLIMTLIYGYYLFAREVMGWRGRKACILAIVGFVIALLSYFGPLYLQGVHT